MTSRLAAEGTLFSPNSPAVASLNRIEEVFSRVSASYAGYQVILMPPTWRDRGAVVYTFVLFNRELDQEELRRFLTEAVGLRLPNPRPICAPLLELASMFHPLFFAKFASGRGRLHVGGDLHAFFQSLRGARLIRQPVSQMGVASARYYLQSVLFLAGCTLSAAIVQDRYSEGTIQSKLDRLWQAAQYARRFGYHDLDALDLENFVRGCAKPDSGSNRDRLFALKKTFGAALTRLKTGLATTPVPIHAARLSSEERDRFGFIDELRDRLGTNLECVFVYGSAVTSGTFSDYDLIVLVGDSGKAFEKLAGLNPTYRGFEINMSIYAHDEFYDFQTMSGDNLDHAVRCIYGAAEVPVKPPEDLLIRNFSFAFVRMRQLLGMAAYLAQEKRHAGLEGKWSLYHYFLKIPTHIMKGVLAAMHEPIDKEYLNRWSAEKIGYDIDVQYRLCRAGRTWEAISNAYYATQAIMAHLNGRFRVYEFGPASEADLWRHLEPGILSDVETREQLQDFVT